MENLEAEHGRGIQLMKLVMDDVSFEGNGTEVHMRKASVREQGRIPGSSANSAKGSTAFADATSPLRGEER
jgi:hypothetical protein